MTAAPRARLTPARHTTGLQSEAPRSDRHGRPTKTRSCAFGEVRTGRSVSRGSGQLDVGAAEADIEMCMAHTRVG
jgi:hypothetical protein